MSTSLKVEKIWMAELGRKGGKATSTSKSAAARLNGKKGGRPKKNTSVNS
jgi:general stress protein YciG